MGDFNGAQNRINLDPLLGTFWSVILVLAIRIQNFLKSELVRLVGFEQKKNFENRTIFIFELRWRPLPQIVWGQIWVISFWLECSKSKDGWDIKGTYKYPKNTQNYPGHGYISNFYPSMEPQEYPLSIEVCLDLRLGFTVFRPFCHIVGRL